MVKHFAARHTPGHRDELRRAVEASRVMAGLAERHQVTPRPAPEIEDRIWRITFDRVDQSRPALAHVMIPGAGPELAGPPIVISQGDIGDPAQRVRVVVSGLFGH